MTKKRRNLFCARILCASILFSLAAPVSAEETASAVSVEAPEYVLMEPETGTVILEKDKDVPRSPASVTKVMTLLLIFEEIEKGNLKLDDTVTTSAHAKSMGEMCIRDRFWTGSTGTIILRRRYRSMRFCSIIF